MEFFPSRTTFVSIFGLHIQWYAVLILTGAILAYLLSKHNIKKYKNIDSADFIDNLFLLVLWTGILGARLWYCLFENPSYYFSNPVSIIRLWDGGLAIHGGLIAAVTASYFYCKKKNVPFLKVADACVPTVFIGQAFGRWGNFVNQECHGAEVSAEYFDGILSFLKDGMYIDGHYYEPMFFYESVGCLVGFFLINYLLRKYQYRRGQLMYAYMLWYGVLRFFIESRRTDSLMFFGLKTAQLISIALALAGFLGFIGVFDKFIKKKKPTIVFDFDGTLANSTPAIIATYKELFKRHDKVENFTEDKQKEVLGPALYTMFAKYWPNLDSQALFDEYQEITKDELKKSLKMMPHGYEVLKALKDKGYTVAIASARTKESGQNCLNILELNDLIDNFYGLNEAKKKKPDPELLFNLINDNNYNSEDVIVIGDSATDIEMGKNYGAYTIGYIESEGRKEQLINSKPNRVITDLNEILDIVEEDHYFTYNLK